MATEFRPDLGNTDAGDLRRFYALVSQCVGHKLDPEADRAYLSKPTDWLCRNSIRHMIRCRINDDRWVVMKRCLDEPELMRREILIASIKSRLGWVPNYSVIPAHDIRLREASTGHNCPILRGWEIKALVAIDAGDCASKTKRPQG